jgi:hypothetical protein
MSWKGSVLRSIFIDAPQVLDATVTPIPANTSSPLQIVANLSTEIQGFEVGDGIQQGFIGVYVGDVGQEVLVDIIGGPSHPERHIAIAKGSRISLRSMNAQSMTTGLLKLVFIAG